MRTSRLALRILVAALALTSLTTSSQAQVLTGTFPIDSAQEVPTNSSTASGVGTVTLDLATNVLSWNITFSGLSGAQTAAHFHGPAPAGSNAGVQINIGTGSPNVGSTTLTGAQSTQVQNGMWYANIHSSGFPGGEIRGQVLLTQAVPATSLGSVLASVGALAGIGILLLVHRRQRALGTS